MRYWLVRPGWSTSCTALAKMAARVSRGVNTASSAGVHSSEFMDSVTSAACVLL